jgi:uncharacterized membrane protein YqhA
MDVIKRLFESLLWNSRFVVVIAVVASVVASFTAFYIATVDVIYIVKHIVPYASGELTDAARSQLRTETVTHIVDVVDGYLLALVMLMFGLGMYELFVSDLREARESRTSSRILVIDSLDALKNRLAKVIIMILIVRLFEQAVGMEVRTMLDLLYLAAAISLVGLALYFSHKSEAYAPDAGTEAKNAAPEKP